MKPLSFILLFAALITSQALHAVEAVTKHGADDTLTDSLATGANALTVSASGTIVFQSGFTLTGAAYLRTAADLQQHSSILDAVAASTTSTGVFYWNAGTVTYIATSTGGNGSDDAGKLVKFGTGGTITGLLTGAFEGGSAENWVAVYGDGLHISKDDNGGLFLPPAAGGGALEWTLPSTTGTLIGTGDTGTVSSTMLAASGATAGTYGSATKSLTATVNAKGLVTAMSEQTVTPAESSVTFTDITTGNASTSKHGYLPKLDGSSTHYLNGAGAWSTPPSGITINTTAVSGASAGDLLTTDGSVVTKLTPGSGVAAALPNDVNASGGLLTYGIIGTSGTKVPLLNVTNTWSSVQTFAVGAAYGDNIARFESPLTGTGMTVRTVSNSDFGGAFVGAPIIAFDFDNFFVKGDLYLPKAAATINLGQMTITSNNQAIYQVGGGTALGGTHIRLGNDGTYQGNLQIHSGDNTVVTTITTTGDIEAAGDVSMQGALTVGNGTPHKKIKSGTLTLSGGAGTVYDTAVIGAGSFDAQSRIIITRMYDAGTIGCSFSVTRADGTSFTVYSKDSTGTTESGDNSTVSWLLINP